MLEEENIFITWLCEGSQGLLYNSQPLSPVHSVQIFSNKSQYCLYLRFAEADFKCDVSS